VREVALAMLASLIGGSIAAPFVFKLLVKLKSAQNVSAHLEGHQHKQGTPTMGGIIVLIGLLCGMACTWRAEYLGVLVLVLGFAAVGFADDYLVPKMKPGSRGLHWMPKLGLEIGAAVGAAVMSGWQTPVELGLFIFMVLFLSNAYNFSDGLDTLSGGLGMLLCLGLLLLLGSTHWWAEPVSPPVAAALLVGFLPFLFYNAPPAKVFMGDVGALPIGAVLAWVAATFLMPEAELGAKLWPSNFAPLLVLFGMMFAEIIPPPLQVFWVKLFKKRAFNFKTPIHHAFEDLGWPHTRIVWAFHVVQAALVVLALAWMWL
jgi:phospho-N-acetylmuramoyl-pentapeptide-transferase